MKTTRTTLGAALVAAFVAALVAGGVAAPTALSAPAGPPPGGRGVAPMRAALEYAGLSDEQKAKALAIGEESRAKFADLARQARADRQALQDLVAAPSPDPKVVGTAFLKLDADRKAMKGARDKAEADLRALLTPEQKVKFDAYLQGARKDRRAMAMGRFGPGPGAGQ